MPTSCSPLLRVLVPALALSGCLATHIESSYVQQRFETLFQCTASTAHPEDSGYRVEGCGQVAHFRCFDTDDDSDEDFDEAPLGAVLVGALIEGALASETCVLEHSEQVKSTPQGQPLGTSVSKHQEDLLVRTRVLISEGHIGLLGKPLRHPAHTLLTLHSTPRLPEGACPVELFLDGVPLPVEQNKRLGPYEVRVLIRTAQLRDADRSVRFAGSFCGHEFELDDQARKGLAVYEARFREEVARAATNKTSGGEADSRAMQSAERRAVISQAEAIITQTGASPPQAATTQTQAGVTPDDAGISPTVAPTRP